MRWCIGFLLFLTVPAPVFAQPPLPIIGYLKGDNQNDRLGTTLAGPGDVNGDGYADLLAAELGTKRVKLFYGNSGRIDSIPDMVWNGYISVRTIGDINGDGKSEVVMGTDSAHQLRIFWGGTSLDTIPDFILDFGDTTCVGGKGIQDISAGDLNGDGYGDLVVSTIYGCGAPIYSLGRAEIFWGGPLLDTIPDWKRTIPAEGIGGELHNSFGKRAKVLSNLNNDSFSDLIVSEMGNGVRNTTGRVYIFLGGNPMDSLEDQVVNAPPPAGDGVSQWGFEIIPLNDLNGDGRTDIWVGGGGAYLRLYYGNFPIDSVPSAIFDQGGDRPAPGGDFNQDGFTDLILGQPRPSFLAGSIFIYLGSSNMNGNYDIAIHDFQLQGYVAEVLGLAVTNIGDMNGDGVDDFAASAKLGVDPFDVGEVFVFSGDSLIPTGVKGDKGNLPRSFELYQNSPNPFSSSTGIGFELKPNVRPESVRLEVFNLMGQRIGTLVNERGKTGERRVLWDGRDEAGNLMPSGIYFYKLSYGDEIQVKKMLLIR